MKIKNDFVTNSSSTSYLFIYKGKTINDLFSIMKDCWRDFELSMYGNHTNVYDIISYMRDNHSELNDVPIVDQIEYFKKRIKETKKWIGKGLNEDYTLKLIQADEAIIELLEYKKKKGFNFVVVSSFSDEGGDQTGSTLRCYGLSLDRDKLRVISIGGE